MGRCRGRLSLRNLQARPSSPQAYTPSETQKFSVREDALQAGLSISPL